VVTLVVIGGSLTQVHDKSLLCSVTLAKPHPPSGEIAISDLGEDSVTLSWSPPIDDELPVDEYVIEVKGMFIK